MKKGILVFLCIAASTQLRAEDDGLFLSLTRSAESPEHLPTNVEVITADQIKARGAQTLDEALQWMPSAQVQKTGPLGSFSTLRLRGSPSSAQVQVLVDDVPLGGISTQFVDLSQIPLNDVDRIEVIRGGSSVLYGANTMGGVVNIITKRHQGDKAQSSVSGEGRAFFTQIYRGDVSSRAGRWDGRVTAGRQLTDGFQKNSNSDQTSASGYGAYSLPNGTRFSLDLSRVDSEVGDPGGTFVPLGDWNGHLEKTPTQTKQRVDTGSTRTRLEAAVPVGEKGFWETTAFAFDQDYVLTSEYGPASDTDRTNIVMGADTHIRWGGTTLGLSHERDERRVDDGHSGSFRTNNIENLGAYAQENLAVGSWTLLPAVRWDNHSTFGDTVNPRFAAVFAPGEQWKFSGSAARSFRAPDMSALFDFFPGSGTVPCSGCFPASVPNPDLKPEIAWTYDAGFEHKDGHGVFGVSGFFTRIKDRMYGTQNSLPLTNTTLNGPRAELSGAEVKSAHRWTSKIASEASYTYLRALGNTSQNVKYVPLRLSPRHQAYYRLTLGPGKGWTWANEVRYVDKQFTNEDEKGFKIPSHTIWGTRFTKHILRMEIFLAAENLTDKHYADTGSNFSLNPQPGRTYSGGVTIRFSD